MNISYNWLKRYLKTDLSAEEMATVSYTHLTLPTIA